MAIQSMADLPTPDGPGDLAALCASLAIIVYLLVGRSLRQWMPLFVYAFPGGALARWVHLPLHLKAWRGPEAGGPVARLAAVTALAAVELTTAGAALEGARFTAAGAHGVFGWAASPHYLPLVLYLAGPGRAGPGIVGPTGERQFLPLEWQLRLLASRCAVASARSADANAKADQ